MNGSGKQSSFYEIQLSNASLIVAFLVAVAIGVTVFVLGVMVGRGQTPEQLPESGWTQEPLAAGSGNPAGTEQPMEEVTDPVPAQSGDMAPAENAVADAGNAADDGGLDDVIVDDGPVDQQPQAPAGLPADDPSLVSGWVVQVKATPNAAEARGLQETLARAGFPTFLVEYDDGGTAMFRVRVGRYGDRADAEQVATALNRRTDIGETWVTQG